MWEQWDETELTSRIITAANDSLLRFVAVRVAAEYHDISISRAERREITQAIREMHRFFENREAFNRELENNFLTEQVLFELRYNDWLEFHLFDYLTHPMNQQIPSDIETVRRDIAENFFSFAHIRIARGDCADTARELAQDVHERIVDGEDIFRLARTYSMDTIHRRISTRGEMWEVIEGAVLNLQIGDTHHVIIESMMGFHIVQRIAITSADIDRYLDELRESYLVREVGAYIGSHQERLSFGGNELFDWLTQRMQIEFFTESE